VRFLATLVIVLAFAVVVTGGTAHSRNLNRRMKFSRLYGNGEGKSVALATQPVSKVNPIRTGDLKGMTFRTISGPDCKLKLHKARKWEAKSPLFEQVFEWKQLTGLRYGVVNKTKSAQTLVLLVDQPGVPPLEGIIERVGEDEQEKLGASYEYRLRLPVGSLTDGEILTLYGK